MRSVRGENLTVMSGPRGRPESADLARASWEGGWTMRRSERFERAAQGRATDEESMVLAMRR